MVQMYDENMKKVLSDLTEGLLYALTSYDVKEVREFVHSAIMYIATADDRYASKMLVNFKSFSIIVQNFNRFNTDDELLKKLEYIYDVMYNTLLFFGLISE